MHIDRIPVYRVYQRAIDLELYHAFAELVVQTSQDDTARRIYRQTRAMQIWQGGGENRLNYENGCVRLF